jgi:hypothetical protein
MDGANWLLGQFGTTLLSLVERATVLNPGGSLMLSQAKCCWLVLGFTVFLGSQALAYSAWQDPYIRQLRSLAVNYQVEGAICEQVARLELLNEYNPRQYQIEVNMAYGAGSQTLGELDVVVIETYSGLVVLVAEVKCWTEPGRAQAKGSSQRQRFMGHLNATRDLWIQHDGKNVSLRRFSELKNFILIGQNGVRRHGFERELKLDLDELMGLRRTMMDCQRAGDCLRP